MATPPCYKCGYVSLPEHDDASSKKRWHAGDVVCTYTPRWEALEQIATGRCKAFATLEYESRKR